MLSPARRILACILFLGLAALAQAQKEQTATISGNVTLQKKALARVAVVAADSGNYSDVVHPHWRGITDEAGNYRISGLPPGNYYVYPVAPALVVENEPPRQQVVIAPGETIRDVDFAMVQGGVITGRITNADGQPLIEEPVVVTPIDYQAEFSSPEFAAFRTDDRGIYRIFGLRRGKYRVSVGNTGRILPGQTRRTYRETFYPSVNEREKATILEVNDASELRGIDIVAGPPLSTFRVTGRIIDGETGKPVPNVTLSVSRTDGEFTANSIGPTGSDSHGEFRIENLLPGRYMILPVSETSNWRVESATFDVVDRDLTGLEIRTKRGASMSGVVVVKNNDEKPLAATFAEFDVFAFVDNPESDENGTRVARAEPDGRFKIVGLPPGNARLGLSAAQGHQQFTVLSIEQNGVSLSAGINLKEGDQVEGIRIVVKTSGFTGAIRGQIRFENGPPPPSGQVLVIAARQGELPAPGNMSLPATSAHVDARGRFMLGHLESGTYDLFVTVYKPGERPMYETTRQQVTVTSGATTDITVTVKSKP